MQMTEDAVRAWLIKYAWLGDADRQKREVDCIMSQDGWKYIDAVADQFAGAQEEPGPVAYSEGVEFALSALYECHDGPHLPTCPYAKSVMGEPVESDKQELDTCPIHGVQAIVDHGSTGGPDPYAISKLACGDAVMCLGPGDPNIITSFRKDLN